jgi:crotonobetainyl-CoA:carnitine CoA-transferase CaiB-like acyl-CoA transferase
VLSPGFTGLFVVVLVVDHLSYSMGVWFVQLLGALLLVVMVLLALFALSRWGRPTHHRH